MSVAWQYSYTVPTTFSTFKIKCKFSRALYFWSPLYGNHPCPPTAITHRIKRILRLAIQSENNYVGKHSQTHKPDKDVILTSTPCVYPVSVSTQAHTTYIITHIHVHPINPDSCSMECYQTVKSSQNHAPE